MVADFEGNGHVRVLGEIWKASSPVLLVQNQTVIIVNIQGLLLNVNPLNQPNEEP